MLSHNSVCVLRHIAVTYRTSAPEEAELPPHEYFYRQAYKPRKPKMGFYPVPPDEVATAGMVPTPAAPSSSAPMPSPAAAPTATAGSAAASASAGVGAGAGADAGDAQLPKPPAASEQPTKKKAMTTAELTAQLMLTNEALAIALARIQKLDDHACADL
jgi:hypothetical protein